MGLGKENRRKAAIERQEAANNRSAKEQLARLDELFGKGQGAKKERARLESRLVKEQEEKPKKKKKEPV